MKSKKIALLEQIKRYEKIVNLFLIRIVKDVSYSTSKLGQGEKDKIKKFYDGHRKEIKDETKLKLLYFTLWNRGFDKVLTNFLVDELDLNVNDLIILVVKKYFSVWAYERLEYYFDNFSKKISKIQIDEALIYAILNNLGDKIFNILIKNGANEKFLKINKKISSGRNSSNKIKYREKTSFWTMGDRITAKFILAELGHPEKNMQGVIHVTGSNGKGSTCAFLQSILEANGYTVNKYTNPFLIRDVENYVIKGEEIDTKLFASLRGEVEDAYLKIKDNKNYLEEIKKANKYDLKVNKKKIDNVAYNGVLSWSINIPIMALAFSRNKADFNVIEVVVGGLIDFTNVFSENETVATVITPIEYGIGSNDGTMQIINENGEKECSNRATAYHKSKLGKKNVPMIVSSQNDEVLTEIRRVARDEVKTKIYEYDKSWFIEEENTDSFVFRGFGKKLKLNKSKTLFESFQTSNIALAVATLLKLQENKKIILKDELIQKGIDEATIPARPQRVFGGNLVDYFNNKNLDIIYGVIKLNNNGLDSIKNIIKENNEYFNYVIYTSGAKKIVDKPEHIKKVCSFFKKNINKKKMKLFVYKKNEDAFECIIKNLDDLGVKYYHKNNLSSCLALIKELINPNEKSRLLILCNSMVGFDGNIYDIIL
jgi:folylpolyglutamate synthase/dihydrofolate synthase